MQHLEIDISITQSETAMRQLWLFTMQSENMEFDETAQNKPSEMMFTQNQPNRTLHSNVSVSIHNVMAQNGWCAVKQLLTHSLAFKYMTTSTDSNTQTELEQAAGFYWCMDYVSNLLTLWHMTGKTFTVSWLKWRCGVVVNALVAINEVILCQD